MKQYKRWLLAGSACFLIVLMFVLCLRTRNSGPRGSCTVEGTYVKCVFSDGKPCPVMIKENGKWFVLMGKTANHPIVDEMFSSLETGELIKVKVPKSGYPEMYPLGLSVLKWKSVGMIEDYTPSAELVEEWTEKAHIFPVT